MYSQFSRGHQINCFWSLWPTLGYTNNSRVFKVREEGDIFRKYCGINLYVTKGLLLGFQTCSLVGKIWHFHWEENSSRVILNCARYHFTTPPTRPLVWCEMVVSLLTDRDAATSNPACRFMDGKIMHDGALANIARLCVVTRSVLKICNKWCT